MIMEKLFKNKIIEEPRKISPFRINSNIKNNNSGLSLSKFVAPYHSDNHMIITTIKSNKPEQQRVLRKQCKPRKGNPFLANCVSISLEDQGDNKCRNSALTTCIKQSERDAESVKQIIKTIEDNWNLNSIEVDEENEIVTQNYHKLDKNGSKTNHKSMLGVDNCDDISFNKKGSEITQSSKCYEAKGNKQEENKEYEDKLSSEDVPDSQEIINQVKIRRNKVPTNVAKKQIKKLVQCPICTQYIDKAKANNHVNECLTNQELEKNYFCVKERKRKAESRTDRFERRQSKRAKEFEWERIDIEDEPLHQTSKSRGGSASNSSTQSFKSKTSKVNISEIH